MTSFDRGEKLVRTTLCTLCVIAGSTTTAPAASDEVLESMELAL